MCADELIGKNSEKPCINAKIEASMYCEIINSILDNLKIVKIKQ